MFYGKSAQAYQDAIKALELARKNIHYLAEHVHGCFSNLETCVQETIQGIREVREVLDAAQEDPRQKEPRP